MSIVNINEDMWDRVALVKSELRQACALQASLPCRIDVTSTSVRRAGVLLDPPGRVILNITAVVNAQLKTEGWEWNL